MEKDRAQNKKDLIAVVADKSMQVALQSVLLRPHSLAIREVSFSVIVQVNRDCGVRTEGVATISRFKNEFSHALLLLDYEGSGADYDAVNMQTASELRQQLQQDLRRAWGENSDVVVIEPELDIWAWGIDESMRQVLGWLDRPPSIREWIRQQGFELSANGKPIRPKEALEAVCRHLRLARSSALYGELASRLSLQRCEDATFQCLSSILKNWFSK